MASVELDEVDRAILHALQKDARNTTANELGAIADVSPTTVRNRIEKLEESGVIQGYYPHIKYERAGFQPHLFISCRAEPDEREDLAQEALGIVGTVLIREMVSGRSNLYIEAIAEDYDAVETITANIADVGLEIVDVDVVKTEHVQPFNHFGPAPSTDESDD